ncbi:hypothetical protein B0H13DRAFT_1907555 [Mycena leptocephala]|nr:hypothetical protein B0H13DRAFT_1907555 [Mycena leptocephala]
MDWYAKDAGWLGKAMERGAESLDDIPLENRFKNAAWLGEAAVVSASGRGAMFKSKAVKTSASSLVGIDGVSISNYNPWTPFSISEEASLSGEAVLDEVSPDLLSLLRCFNPDFLVCGDVTFQELNIAVQTLLEWLKKLRPWYQKLMPWLQDSFELWVGYHFMLFCDAAWSTGIKFTRDVSTCHYALSHAPPQLMRILHAYRIATYKHNILLNIHLMLDVSWDELRKAVCSLRSSIGTNMDGLRELLNYASNPTVRPKLHSGSILIDLALGYLRVMKSILTHRLPWGFWCTYVNTVNLWEPQFFNDVLVEWHSPDDFHSIIQWLETFPEPPLALMTHLQHHLDMMVLDLQINSERFQESWTEWKEDMQYIFPGHVWSPP